MSLPLSFQAERRLLPVSLWSLLVHLVFLGVLTIWVPERWAWSLVQCGVFALAGWALWHARRFRLAPAAALCCLAALWPLGQLAAGSSVNRGETWVQTLNWMSVAAVFLLAANLLLQVEQRPLVLSQLRLERRAQLCRSGSRCGSGGGS